MPHPENLPPRIQELRAPPHRSLSRSSAWPDHPCADRPTPDMLRWLRSRRWTPQAACTCTPPTACSSAGHAFSTLAFDVWPAAASASEYGPGEQSLTQPSPPARPLQFTPISGARTDPSILPSFLLSFLLSFSKLCLTHSVPGHCRDPRNSSAFMHTPLHGEGWGRERDPWTLG